MSFLFAGYDNHHKFQLYHTDPSGNYTGWKATCIGSNSTNAQSILKQDYKDDIKIDEARALAIKIFSKILESTNVTSEKSKDFELE